MKKKEFVEYINSNKKLPMFPLEVSVILIFTFSSSFRLFLASYTWLLIMLPLTDLLLDTGLRAVPLESAESTI